MTSKEAEAFAHEFVAAFNEGRGTRHYRDLLANGSSLENFGFGLAARTPRGLSDTNRVVSEAIPDLRFQAERFIVTQEAGAIEGVFTGTLQGKLWCAEATGKRATVAGVLTYRRDLDGRVTLVRLYFDGASAAKQWGITI